MVREKLKNKTFIGALCAIFLVGIYTCYVFNKGMPTAEGWYSYYAKCILSGDVAYSDFEYLFTPVYMYLIAGFVKIFGYNIIALRILGVVVYVILTLTIYLILSRVFSVTTSVVATVTGILYLQSEVYTVFYDYVRIMDVFSYLAILFMTLTILHWKKEEMTIKYLYAWGTFTSFFFLVKQNMGGLFLLYSLLLIIFCAMCFRWNKKKFVKNIVKFSIAFSAPVIMLFIITEIMGITNVMINSIFFNALEAKGGILTILFRWIKNGSSDFLIFLLWGVLFVIVLKINEQLNVEYPTKTKSDLLAKIYAITSAIIMILIFNNQSLGNYFYSKKRLDVTILFMVTVVLMFYLLIKSLISILKKKDATKNIVILSLLGAYFSICYGAGMSGGLSIGESVLGLGIIISILIDSFRYKGATILRGAIIIYCMFLSFCCISFKLIEPCLWWGIDAKSIYSNTESLDIPILKGVNVSPEEKYMYEAIVETVQKNTEKEDSIFCFPHIPIFYLLCDRNDPGVYTKVQWFDVSTRESLQKDIQYLKKNLPEAFIVYNLNDGAYIGHEEGFFAGKKSETRHMRDTIYELVNTYNYEYHGNFISGSNNISVFTKRNSSVNIKSIFKKGQGTKINPYQIDSAEKLINLSMLVNQGYSFENIYFKQTCDIDLSNVVWIPAGYIDNNSFEGNYNFNNYEVYNINSSEKNSDNPFGKELFCAK